MLPVPAMLDVLLGCALGLVNGTRHALEPDHVATVSALLADTRHKHSALRPAHSWGAGHALTLGGTGLVLNTLRTEMPERMADTFELLAAVMLVALGARALFSLQRRTEAPVQHSELPAPTFAPSTSPLLLRPLSAGLMHGLAGSGALSALAASRSASLASALLFMLVYAIGAGAGMIALVWLARAPLTMLAGRSRACAALPSVAGALSLLVGLAWGVPIAARFWA